MTKGTLFCQLALSRHEVDTRSMAQLWMSQASATDRCFQWRAGGFFNLVLCYLFFNHLGGRKMLQDLVQLLASHFQLGHLNHHFRIRFFFRTEGIIEAGTTGRSLKLGAFGHVFHFYHIDEGIAITQAGHVVLAYTTSWTGEFDQTVCCRWQFFFGTHRCGARMAEGG